MKLNRDNKWYYVDKEEFKSLKEVLVEFHKFYSCEHEFLKRKIIFFFILTQFNTHYESMWNSI